jgi:hypothetical protein
MEIGFSFTEAFNIPLEWRRWFILRHNARQQQQAEDGQATNNQREAIDVLSKLMPNAKKF